ncbi:MAG: hypothetical protein RJB26_2392 [Pseudomonadota bacterium]
MTNQVPASGKQLLGQPIGLASLFLTEMWERFTFYGMRAILVLFLVAQVSTGGLGIDDKTATAIYGLYTAAVYLVALPGGYIADRVIGAQKAVIVGGILITLGNVLLGMAGGAAAFYVGLVVIIAGVGLLKPNISAIVAGLYPEGGARRDAGFTIFYMGINLGAFIAPLIVAPVAATYGWSAGFLCAAAGMALGVVQFLSTRHWLQGAGSAPALPAGTQPDWKPTLIGTGLVAAAVAAVALGVVKVDPVSLAKGTAWVIASMAVLYFAWILLFGGLDTVEKKRVGAIIVLFIACAAFWSGFEQAGSSLNLFAERYTDRLVGSWEIPSGIFQSLNPVFILLFAPLFSALWVQLAKRQMDPSAPAKFALGLIIMGSGFLVMVQAAGIVAAGMKAAPYWLVFTYMLHTMGELCLSPVGLSNITKLAPARYVGQMMGIWFLATSLGNLAAGLIAGEFDAENVAAMPGQYLHIVLFAVGTGVVTLLLVKPVKNWMGGVK